MATWDPRDQKVMLDIRVDKVSRDPKVTRETRAILATRVQWDHPAPRVSREKQGHWVQGVRPALQGQEAT